jgi:hypothetical protein
MSPEELHLRMVRFESRAGSSEGRLTYDSGVMHNIGVRPDELGPIEYEHAAPSAGHVRYERTPDQGWVATFVDPR